VLKPEQLAQLQVMIHERHEALELEIPGDTVRSRDEPYSLLAGPVAVSGT